MEVELDYILGPVRLFSPIFKQMVFVNATFSKVEDHKIKNAAFKFIKEPIFSQIIHNVSMSQALTLKKKARILLRNSCYLIGVCDDSGILEEDEVFI